MTSVRDCLICQSPHRKELDSLLKKRIPVFELVDAYYHFFANLYKNETSFSAALNSHYKKKHPPSLAEALPKNSILTKDIQPMPATTENYAQQLLEAGMDPVKIATAKHADIIGAQRLLIEKEKLKLQNDALKLAMIKFMAGLSDPEDEKVILGEE